MQQFIFRISECSTEIAETRRQRNADFKDLETTTKELAVMSDAEKQRIIVQISAVQTELKRTMDERYIHKWLGTVTLLSKVEHLKNSAPENSCLTVLSDSDFCKSSVFSKKYLLNPIFLQVFL